MNRHYDGQEFIEGVDDVGGALDALFKTGGPETGLVQFTSSVLSSVIRNSVFPKARSQIASKGMIQLEEPEFPDILIRQFLDMLLAEAGTYNRDLVTDYLNKSGSTLLGKTLFLEAAARTLGRQWTEDACDFVETTIAAARLQHLAHHLGTCAPHIPETINSPKVQIVCLKDEQHTLMSVILDLLFRSIGWRTSLVFEGDYKSGQKSLVKGGFDILCFSWSNERCIESVARITSDIRDLSSDQRPVVIAGGPAAEPRVNTLRSMGVDCICDTIYAAVNISERYVSLRTSSYRFEEARKLLSHSLHMDSQDYE